MGKPKRPLDMIIKGRAEWDHRLSFRHCTLLLILFFLFDLSLMGLVMAFWDGALLKEIMSQI